MLGLKIRLVFSTLYIICTNNGVYWWATNIQYNYYYIKILSYIDVTSHLWGAVCIFIAFFCNAINFLQNKFFHNSVV